jgi:uncharacterized protein (DUF1330 family)
MRMKYYSVAKTENTDQGWISEYAKNLTRMAEQRGGRFARTSKVEKIEGERRALQILAIIEWPSKDAMHSLGQF